MGVRPGVGTSRPGPVGRSPAATVRGIVDFSPGVEGLCHWPAAHTEAGAGPSWVPNRLVDMGDREASPPPLPSV